MMDHQAASSSLIVLLIGLLFAATACKPSADSPSDKGRAGFDLPPIGPREPSPYAPAVEDLQTRFSKELPDLLARARTADDQVDQDVFWKVFCDWLDQQQDVSANAREEFRHNLRVELGRSESP